MDELQKARSGIRPVNRSEEGDSDPNLPVHVKLRLMGLAGGAASGVYFWWFP